MLFMPREFRIRDAIVNDSSDALVLADISHNHLGSYELAREMVRLAAQAGCGGVKFQKRGWSTYAGLRRAGEGDYADLREKRELEAMEYAALSHYAHTLGVHFIVTVFDQESADFTTNLGVDAIKIASGDVTNTPLLEYVAKLGKPMIVSTGGATEEDVNMAFDTLSRVGASFALLHCTSEYPVSGGRVNLRLIDKYRSNYPHTVIGFSSHVHRKAMSMVEQLAYFTGARIFEKHFTITPQINTGEHAFAMTPLEMAELVSAIKVIPAIMGSGEKKILDSEATGILRLGKHLVYARELHRGQFTVAEDFAVEAPGNGVPPNRMPEFVGHRALANFHPGESVAYGDTTLGEGFIGGMG
jgi:sialic acid synthase